MRYFRFFFAYCQALSSRPCRAAFSVEPAITKFPPAPFQSLRIAPLSEIRFAARMAAGSSHNLPKELADESRGGADGRKDS
jgi:hypothetical protein